MPVSVTENATTLAAEFRISWSALQPPGTTCTVRLTPPCAVNLNALESRFFSTCSTRFESVNRLPPARRGSTCTSNHSPRLSASWRKLRLAVSISVWNETSSGSTVTVPDSIFDRSRMSVIRLSRSLPAPWIVRANSTCFGVRLPSVLFPSCWPSTRMLFSGVRSSCDMFARNSDLYFEVSASSAALSSSARRACSISWFLRSTSAFCSASCCAFCASCSLVCCSSFWPVCSSAASCWDCCRSASVCIVDPRCCSARCRCSSSAGRATRGARARSCRASRGRARP